MRIGNLWLLAAGAILASGSLVWGADAAGDQPTNKKILAGPTAARTEKAGPAVAARKEGAPGERGARLQKLREILQELNLTDHQKSKIKESFQDEKAQYQAWESAHKDEINTLREDMRKAIQDRDRDKVKALTDKLMDLLATAPKLEDFISKIKAVLTDDQKTQFEQKVKELREHAGDGGPATRPAEKLRALREKRGA